MEIVKDSSLIQNEIERFVNKDVYIHLETTNGAYASHINEKMMTVGAFIRNAIIRFEREDNWNKSIPSWSENGSRLGIC